MSAGRLNSNGTTETDVNISNTVTSIQLKNFADTTVWAAGLFAEQDLTVVEHSPGLDLADTDSGST